MDAAVRRIEMTYEVRGMREHLTSYDNPAIGQGNIVNDVLFVYNDFGQLTTDYQSHEDAVNPATTPKVQYTYADGAENTVRPMALVYPNGRELHYDYGSTGEMNDAASRVASLIDDDGTTHLVDYSYLGQGSVVEQESPQPNLLYTLVSLTSSNDPDTGDIYAGLDRFGRVKDLRWRNTDSDTDLSRVEYGYNRASNRIWRRNPTDPNAHYDWLYTYDAVQRLKFAERGTLNGMGTAITDPQFTQCWSLDETGNWHKFLQDDDGDATWNLNQSRTSSTANEITNISETAGPNWVTPAYSRAGNMTTMPQPADPTASYTATYDAWNRLVKLVEGVNTVQENEYDGRNFRVIKKSYASGVLNETRDYYFSSNWQILEERIDGSSTPDRHFVWGTRYIDDLICRDRSDTGTLDERLYACPDANWNVTALVNTSGAVAERIEYDPYGNTTWLSSSFVVQSSSSYDWETTYCSYRYENNTGLFHIRHRNYHPILGIWLQRDPLGLSAGVILYAYANHNYLNKIDPRGLDVIVFDGPGPAGGIPAPKPKPGQVCGFYVWLYTGRACVDEDVYEDALDAAAEVLTCWWNCELKTHTKITNVVSGTGVSTASWSVLTYFYANASEASHKNGTIWIFKKHIRI
ncbi:MAG: RHS repeat-associated core domain-containing protein [Planctomycetaceae bacterium]